MSNCGTLKSYCFVDLCPRRVRSFFGDVFSYLFHKGEVYPCTSCKKDVPYRGIVKCSSCQGNCHKECTSVVSKGGSATSNLTCKRCLQKRNLMLTNYRTNVRFIQPQLKNAGQQQVAAPRVVFKVGSSYSAEPALKVEALPVAMVKALPFAKVAAQPIMNVKIQPITYFGLVWKKNKNDKYDGSDFRANDVILKCKDGIGSSIKPTCCLCNKTYSPDFLYVRCERCRNWFHGDALQLDDERIGEVVAYRCCRCRRRAIPQCPHSDDYTKHEQEFSEQTVATSSQSTMLSGEEAYALADQDPLLASYEIVEPVGEETVDADLSTSMLSFAPGRVTQTIL